MRTGLVWAQARGGVIGADGGMPWHVPEDLAHFKKLTLGCPVVMGRRTWDSLPPRFRPLPERVNIVVTRRPDWQATGALRASSLVDALRQAAGADWVWVTGGGQIFREAIAAADRLEVTDIDLDVPGDTTAPSVVGWRAVASDPAGGWHTSRTGLRYRFVRYER